MEAKRQTCAKAMLRQGSHGGPYSFLVPFDEYLKASAGQAALSTLGRCVAGGLGMHGRVCSSCTVM